MRKPPKPHGRPLELHALQQQWAEEAPGMIFGDCSPLALTGSPPRAPDALRFREGVKSHSTTSPVPALVRRSADVAAAA